MDAGAPIFKRKKSRPNRQREVEADGAGEDVEATGQEESPMTLAAKLKNKPQSRLSFNDPEEVRIIESF
jgi:hypothetical protein